MVDHLTGDTLEHAFTIVHRPTICGGLVGSRNETAEIKLLFYPRWTILECLQEGIVFVLIATLPILVNEMSYFVCHFTLENKFQLLSSANDRMTHIHLLFYSFSPWCPFSSFYLGQFRCDYSLRPIGPTVSYIAVTTTRLLLLYYFLGGTLYESKKRKDTPIFFWMCHKAKIIPIFSFWRFLTNHELIFFLIENFHF